MSIKRDIIESSPFFKTICKDYPNFMNDPYAFAYAIEGHFRIDPNLGSIDGFNIYHVVKETYTALNLVGLAWFVQNSNLLPLEVLFQVMNQDINYHVLLGAEDQVWENMSEKKRWSAVYQYATEGVEPTWNWGNSFDGMLRT